jgi:TetR/AcrR family transcriptional regulator
MSQANLVETSNMAGGAGGRQRLLQAAAVEFAEHGFAGASIAGIAAGAGVGKSTVFHHFDSKQDLYLAVIAEAATEFGRRLDDMLQSVDDPEAGLRAFQRQHLAHITSNSQVATLVLRELQDAGSERAVSLVREVLAPNFRRLTSYLERALDAGTIRAGVDCEAAAMTLFAANVFYFQNRAMLAHLPESRLAENADAFAAAVSDLVFRGLAKDS